MMYPENGWGRPPIESPYQPTPSHPKPYHPKSNEPIFHTLMDGENGGGIYPGPIQTMREPENGGGRQPGPIQTMMYPENGGGLPPIMNDLIKLLTMFLGNSGNISGVIQYLEIPVPPNTQEQTDTTDTLTYL
jgi:hypothetical protein